MHNYVSILPECKPLSLWFGNRCYVNGHKHFAKSLLSHISLTPEIDTNGAVVLLIAPEVDGSSIVATLLVPEVDVNGTVPAPIVSGVAHNNAVRCTDICVKRLQSCCWSTFCHLTTFDHRATKETGLAQC